MELSTPLSPGQSARFIAAHLRWMALYLAIVALARWWISPALEFDEAEQVLHRQHLLMGYGAQPPGFEWVMQALTALGMGMAPALLGFKAMLLWLVFAATVTLIDEASHDARLAVACGYAIFLLPQLAWEAPRTLTHTVLATACVAVSALLLRRVAVNERPRTADVVLLGLALGAGLLSKHSFVASMGLFGLVLALQVGSAAARAPHGASGTRWGPRVAAVLAAGALGLMLAGPHLLWLLSHAGDVVSTIQSKMGPGERGNRVDSASVGTGLEGLMHGLQGLVLGLAGFGLVPALLIGAVAWKSRVRTSLGSAGTEPAASVRAREALALRLAPLRRLLGRHAMLFLMLCLALVFLAGATRFRDRWLTPFLYLTPALAVLMLAGMPGVEACLIRATRVFLVVVGALLILRVPLGPSLGKPGWLNVPVADIASSIQRDVPPETIVLVDNIQVAGGLKLHLPRHAVYQVGSTFATLAEPRGCAFLLLHAPAPGSSVVADGPATQAALAALRRAASGLAVVGFGEATPEPWRWSGPVTWGVEPYAVEGERWRLPCGVSPAPVSPANLNR